MPEENKKKISPLVLVLVAVVTLSVLGIGAFFLFSTKKQVANTQVSNLPVPTTESKKTTIAKIGTAKKVFSGGYADPSIIKKSDGSYLMYLNKFGNGPSGYLVLSSTDAESWAEKTGIIFTGISVGRAFQTQTGIRFYYPEQMPLVGSTGPMPSLLSSFSTDGLKFSKDSGKRVVPRDGYFIGGSTVFNLKDGSLRMYFEEIESSDPMKRKGVIWGASSQDGLTWSRDSKPTIEPETAVENAPADWPQALHPYVVKKSDGKYLMFYNTHSKIYAAESVDGLTWVKLGGLDIRGADSDGVFLPNGNFRLYYGDFNEKTGGEVYFIDLKIS